MLCLSGATFCDSEISVGWKITNHDQHSRNSLARFTTFAKHLGVICIFKYVQTSGDEYAINYHASTYSTNISADTHELQPLLHRGMPDGGTYGVKSNGSLNHNTFAEVSTGTMPPNSPNRFTRSPNQLDYPHASTGPRSDQFHLSHSLDPDDSQAQLPTRTNPTSHGMWPIRGRNTGTMGVSGHSLAAASPRVEATGGVKPRRFDSLLPNPVNSETPTTVGGASPRNLSRQIVPLASREDSWLTEAPDSPAWHPPTNGNPGIMNRRSPGVVHRPDSSLAHEGPSIPCTAQLGGRTGQFNPQLSRTDDSSSYLLPPIPAPIKLPEDGYLEPKSTPVTPLPGFPVAADQVKNERPEPVPGTVLEDEYLTPKRNSPTEDITPATDFGISNMEYFMQPYLPPSSCDYPDTQRTVADGSENDS
ncbi:hypothetical protein D915_002361 [Fasciola hepatica]|uniref:Uncharacterized protein n=1 Tax=Fasciola hepatica TaxID=6192 RepID=A0A4E0RM84_FASHE|nr:hypothetical protein D915_002361 [Fasciola hepatica]